MGPEKYSRSQRAFFEVYAPEMRVCNDYSTKLLTAALPALQSHSWEEGLPLWEQSLAEIPLPNSQLDEMYLNVAKHGTLGMLAGICGNPTLEFAEKRRELVFAERLAATRKTPFNVVWYSQIALSLGSFLVQWPPECKENMALDSDSLKAVIDADDIDFEKCAHQTLSYLDSTLWDLSAIAHKMAELLEWPKELEDPKLKCVETIVRILDVDSVLVGVRKLIDQMKEHPHGEAILIGYVHEDVYSIRRVERLVGEIMYPDKNHLATSDFDDSHLNFDILASAAEGFEGSLNALCDGIESANAKEVEALLTSVYKSCQMIVDAQRTY